MLRTTLLLALVAAVTALEMDTSEQVIRVGSIGSAFATLRGMLIPLKDRILDGIPAYEVRTILRGMPVMDDELMNFRCSLLDDFFVPLESAAKPIMLCRNMRWARESMLTDRKSFLFSADDLKITPGMRTIDLWIGRTMWANIMSDITLFRDDVKETVVRIGSIGTHFADLKGLLVPFMERMVDGVPSYMMRSMVKGVPLMEDELMSFRCSLLNDFFVPVEDIKKPVMLCRNMKWTRDSSVMDKKIFLFSAEDFKFTPEMKTIDLWLGKTTIHDLF
ncbi:uncharacterized protein LOC124153860 [Ischnura elegans]|uniref:uncharacterized protein LOC124153860 n=1 Tax=Ischnura elegans TaxID=197161 RepID=UPI001ED8BAD0|nr:uncharacterized protein LOC124153860 [Ischnura elegans]